MSAELPSLIGLLLGAPALVFIVLYFVFARRALVAGAATALLSAAAGAFLAAAGSAMATSVDPNEAMLRGAVIGLVGGAFVSIVLALLLTLLRRWRVDARR